MPMGLTAEVDNSSTVMSWNAWVSLATAVACFAFVVAYAVLARWWQTYEGRVMMGKAIAIGLLTLSVMLLLFPLICPPSTPLWSRPSDRQANKELLPSAQFTQVANAGHFIAGSTDAGFLDRLRAAVDEEHRVEHRLL